MTERLWRALARALARTPGGADVAIEPIAARAWSSALFSGARMSLAAAGEAGSLGAWLKSLPDADLAVPGHYVADVCVSPVAGGRARLDLLLIEEG